MELLGEGVPSWVPGLVVVGSHVQKSSDQLAGLLALPRVSGIELNVPSVLDDSARAGTIETTTSRIDDAVEAKLFEKLKNPEFKEGKLTFSAVRKFMGNTIPIDYTLTIDGDKLKGKGVSDYGNEKREFEIEGKREK